MKHTLSGHKAVISALISLWIVVTVLILDLLRIEAYWPTFAVLNLLTIIGFKKQNIAKVFLSCFAGIGISLLFVYASGAMAPFLGASASGFLMLFLVIFAILVFDEVLSICLNAHTFIVFAFCMVNAHEFAVSWPHTIASAVLGGGVALGGILGIMKLAPRLGGKRAASEAHRAE